jgi:molybdate transport system substrate-binding protein
MRVSALVLLLVIAPAWSAEPLRIAVASNFKPTLDIISQRFEDESGISVLLSSASTGVLATQIQYGAPFDLFFAADAETPRRVMARKAGYAEDAFCYARGSLVLAGGEGKLSSLADSNLSMAIANPSTAPYGRAALDVLARPEFKDGLARKLVRGNNVAQAYQFWKSGAVDLALLPASLAPATATPIPLTWHEPLEQYALVLKPSTAVDSYLNWVRSDTVRALITDAGYEPCL